MGFAEFIATIPAISVILFLVGLLLLVIEMFTPGFGVAGGLGILFLIVDVIFTAKTFAQGLAMSAFFALLILILLIISVVLASKGLLPKKLVLGESLNQETGYTSAASMQHLLGKTGVTKTALRPAGNAEFDGVKYDVVSRGDYVGPGTEVEVVEVEGNRIVVRVAQGSAVH